MKGMRTAPGLVLATILLNTGPAQATLLDRGPNLVYDTVLDITWVRDANLYKTLEPTTGGTGVWDAAVAWAENLVYEGYADWRLASASVSQSGLVTSIVDCATDTEVNCRDNELGYNFYHNLSGSSGDRRTGDLGPFIDIQDWYWSGTEFSADSAWDFRYFNGDQDNLAKVNGNAAWAVRSGDVSIPLPGTAGLIAVGLLGVGAGRRFLSSRQESRSAISCKISHTYSPVHRIASSKIRGTP